jgi:excisionase family DNA binding protein
MNAAPAARDRLLTPAEAAEMLSTSPRALDHRRRNGEVPFVLLGRLVRYRESTVLRFMTDHEITLAPRRRGRPRKVQPIQREETAS